MCMYLCVPHMCPQTLEEGIRSQVHMLKKKKKSHAWLCTGTANPSAARVETGGSLGWLPASSRFNKRHYLKVVRQSVIEQDN